MNRCILNSKPTSLLLRKSEFQRRIKCISSKTAPPSGSKRATSVSFHLTTLTKVTIGQMMMKNKTKHARERQIFWSTEVNQMFYYWTLEMSVFLFAFSLSEHFQSVPRLWECERAESQHDVWAKPDQRGPGGLLPRPQRSVHGWWTGDKGHRHPARQHPRWEPTDWWVMTACLTRPSSLRRRGGFQCVGVFREPGVSLLLRLLCSQRRHSHPPGPVQPGGAVRDPAEPRHLLAQPAESSHAAPGQPQWGRL